MATIENLKPFNELTEEEHRQLASKGGKASVEARRKKKALKELLEEALEMETTTGNKYVDITRALIEQAANGNVKAFEVIRDTMGQKPADRTDNTNVNVEISNEDKEMLERIKQRLNEK